MDIICECEKRQWDADGQNLSSKQSSNLCHAHPVRLSPVRDRSYPSGRAASYSARLNRKDATFHFATVKEKTLKPVTTPKLDCMV